MSESYLCLSTRYSALVAGSVPFQINKKYKKNLESFPKDRDRYARLTGRAGSVPAMQRGKCNQAWVPKEPANTFYGIFNHFNLLSPSKT